MMIIILILLLSAVGNVAAQEFYCTPKALLEAYLKNNITSNLDTKFCLDVPFTTASTVDAPTYTDLDVTTKVPSSATASHIEANVGKNICVNFATKDLVIVGWNNSLSKHYFYLNVIPKITLIFLCRKYSS